MLKQFQEFIKQKCLFVKGDTILLTISGGIDSCVMLDLFSQIDISVAIAHCNFCLRGAESDKDEKHVRKLAQKYKIPIHVKHFETKAESQEKKISIQMAARDLRYQWFESLCKTNHYTHIATAHHQNDVLETSIFNLSKGTGIAGLHGILPKSGKVIRPILFALKSDIMTYAKDNVLEWRDDASNNENKYSRNLIRNEVVPLLKRINPNLERTFEQNTEKLAAVEAIFNEQIELFIQKNIHKQTNKFILNIETLKATKVPVMYLFEWIKKYNFNYFQAKEIIKSFENQSGKIFYSTDYQLVRERKELVLFPFNRTETKVAHIELITKKLTIQDYNFEFKTFKKETNFEFSTSKLLAHLDKDKLNFPLSIRTWQEGDEFFPLGMKGRKKKLSDFFINQKIPLHLKKEVLILCSGKDIVWIIGYRLDERFKLNSKTETIFSISASTN
jgi:tRNA(Ile)-lysidine synthase